MNLVRWKHLLKPFVVVALVVGSVATARDSVFRIYAGKDPNQYGQDEQRRRIWELERAVQQLQARVYQLEVAPPPPVVEERWTCRVEAFGKVFAATRPTRGEATTQVIQECAQKHNAMFCAEEKVRCAP